MKYVTPFKNVICNIFYNQYLTIVTALESILQNVPKELEISGQVFIVALHSIGIILP